MYNYLLGWSIADHPSDTVLLFHTPVFMHVLNTVVQIARLGPMVATAGDVKQTKLVRLIGRV
jgi:hypothetical protein